MEVQAWGGDPADRQPATVPAPAAASARNLRPLWRNLILRIWPARHCLAIALATAGARTPSSAPLGGRSLGEDPCCKGLMKVHRTLTRPEEIEFFLRLHGMWEGIIDIPPPPEPPYDIETMEPLCVPALFRWAQQDDSESIDASHVPWQAPELPLDDERILVLDGDPGPPDEFCGS